MSVSGFTFDDLEKNVKGNSYKNKIFQYWSLTGNIDRLQFLQSSADLRDRESESGYWIPVPQWRTYVAFSVNNPVLQRIFE